MRDRRNGGVSRLMTYASSNSSGPVDRNGGRIRIAYVINSMEGGGTTSPVPAIVQVMRNYGVEVRVFALTRRDGRGQRLLDDANIASDIRDGGEKDHWRALRWLVEELRTWQPTHLWTSLTRATLLGQLAGKWLGLPVISWQHNIFLKPANLRLLRLTRRLSAIWVADSAVVAMLTARRLNVPPDRLMTWPIFRADPEAPQASACRPGETLRIGSLGRLHRVKGYDVLLRAAVALQAMGVDFEMIICGEGAQRDELLAYAEANGLTNAHFPGYATDPAAFLASLHLYVQPSWAEGFCIAAHEAMQAGLPVIASAVGELQMSIESGETGDLTAPGSVELLARKIAWWVRDRERLAAMGSKARKMVLQKFAPDSFEAAGRAVLDRLSPDPDQAAFSPAVSAADSSASGRSRKSSTARAARIAEGS